MGYLISINYSTKQKEIKKIGRRIYMKFKIFFLIVVAFTLAFAGCSKSPIVTENFFSQNGSVRRTTVEIYNEPPKDYLEARTPDGCYAVRDLKTNKQFRLIYGDETCSERIEKLFKASYNKLVFK